ncbi:MAG: DUF362 domain-containing protein [bacterium]
MKQSVVSIAKGTDAGKMVEEALSLLGGVDSLIKPKSVVVLKPNAGHPCAPETSVCTSPEFVAAVIQAIRKAQPREIILAEAAAIGCDTMDCFEVSGIGKAARDAGIDGIIDIKGEKDLIRFPIRDARSDLTRLRLPRFLVEADHIVNLPIFKSHSCMQFTCALKNIKGVVEDAVHYQMHQTDLAAAMMDVWSVVKSDLTIADLIRPAEGFGPHSTLPVDFGCVVAGKDPVAVDATACRMVGLDIDKVAYFHAARERGLGSFEENLIEIRGRTIEEVFKQLWLPYFGGFEQWPEYHIHAEGACSSCQGLLAHTLEWLKALGEYDKNSGISIVLGKTRELPKGVDPRNLIVMGDCVKKFRHEGVYAPGCPPVEAGPLWAILDRRTRVELQDYDFDARARHTEQSEIFHGYMVKMKQRFDEAQKKDGKSKKGKS